MKKGAFIKFMEQTLQAIKNNDSAEGQIRYERGSKEDFNVNAFVRVENSMGQGGCLLVNERLKSDENDSKIFVCGNCGYEASYDDLPPAEDLSQRIAIGGYYTDVECPECGALCYPQKRTGESHD